MWKEGKYFHNENTKMNNPFKMFYIIVAIVELILALTTLIWYIVQYIEPSWHRTFSYLWRITLWSLAGVSLLNTLFFLVVLLVRSIMGSSIFIVEIPLSFFVAFGHVFLSLFGFVYGAVWGYKVAERSVNKN